MKRNAPWLLILWLGSVGVAHAQTTSQAQGPQAQRMDEYNRKLLAQLRALDSIAAEKLDQGTQALQEGKYQEAERLLAEAEARTPKFSAIARRKARAIALQGRSSEAIGEARRIFAMDPLKENRALLAELLLQEAAKKHDTAMAEEGMTEIEKSITADPTDIELQTTKCIGAMQNGLMGSLVECGKALEKLAPEEPLPLYFASVSAALSEDLSKAKDLLRKSRERGLPPKMADDMEQKFDDAEAPLWRWGKRIGAVVLVWAAGLLALFSLGKAVSKATMRLGVSDEELQRSRSMRKFYSALLTLSCAYYFASLPLVLLLVVLLGGGVILGILATGYIPVKLVLLIGLAVVGTLWAVLKSALVRPREEAPGELLDLEEHPKLKQLLEEVAAKVGTRPVDSVYLTPGTDIAVFERGDLMAQLKGKTERCLVLGAGVLEGLTLGPMRAILAHEYGHFSNRDTAGGGFALAVRRSLVLSALGLARAGAAGWFNPMWVFLLFFSRIFSRISQGASRLQETLADRWAATCYGAEPFVEGLSHVIRRTVEFHEHTQSTLREVIEHKQPLANLYSFQPSEPAPQEKLDDAVQSAIQRDPDEDESHPAPRDRFAAVRALSPGVISAADDREDAWSLFQDRLTIEESMTRLIREAVQENHDVHIVERAEEGA